jgi:hypothetical protein
MRAHSALCARRRNALRRTSAQASKQGRPTREPLRSYREEDGDHLRPCDPVVLSSRERSSNGWSGSPVTSCWQFRVPAGAPTLLCVCGHFENDSISALRTTRFRFENDSISHPADIPNEFRLDFFATF